ncbi:uncharacterized protein [Littorina saxatilis]|uniref:RCC1 domain-containing protein 1 n=1 Tax=Littorina saxatilis TaxID=31220 RepID=A0AAN9BRM8_9CAEN
MYHAYTCGFNGFGQIEELEFNMKSYLNMAMKALDIDHSETKEQKLPSETATKKFKEHSKHDKTHADTQSCKSPISESRQLQSLTMSTDLTRKRKMKETDDDSVKRPFPSQTWNRNIVLLWKICSFADGIQLEHVEMTWSRCAVTLLARKDLEYKKQYHTVICGYPGAAKDSSESLLLHLSDTEIKTSNEAGMLLQEEDKLLLLREGSRTAEPVTLVTQGSGDIRDASSIGCVSATASEIIIAYDGISVGKVSLECEESESAARKSSGDGPRLVLTCLDSGLSIQQVSCGLEHSVFLMRHGTVLTCGSGSRGQLGHGSLEGEEVPRVVSAMEGLRCVCVSAGGWHSAVVSDCGDLYMWGWNESGQLGLPCPALERHKQHHQSDHGQECLEQQKLAESGETTAASLHLWPQCVDVVDVGCVNVEENAVVQVACGTRHSVVLTERGQVFSTGWNKYGQLGLAHTDSVDQFSCVIFTGHQEATVTQFWCGAWNTFFVVKETSDTTEQYDTDTS